MKTDINPFLVELPEPYDCLPVLDEASWACPSCGRAHEQGEWYTTQVILEEGKPRILVERCPYCDVCRPAENLESSGQWRCGDCGDNHDHPHEALLCCPGDPCMQEGGHCTCRDGIPRELRTDGKQYGDKNAYAFTTFFRCACAEGDECGLYVCIVCHQGLTEQMAKSHQCKGDPVEVYKAFQQAKLEVKEDLEEIISEANQVENCTCNTGFCCELHSVHADPHVLCRYAS